jgi:hypothetical protein
MTVMRRKEMTVKSEHQCIDVMRSKKETSTMTTTTALYEARLADSRRIL